MPRLLTLVLLSPLFVAGCGDGAPNRRRPSVTHDAQCKDPARPKAFFYPSEDGRTFDPDDPHTDGCTLLVPDFLFCCPATSASSTVAPSAR